MPSLQRHSRSRHPSRHDPVVLSLMVQADLPRKQPTRSPFVLLLRHLLDRLLRSDSLGLGEDSASRVFALAYAVALPGLLYAMYLYPVYHSPLGKPPFWTQARDHFFYTTYSFSVMGLATVLQWDLLFPDLLDTLILGTLPLPARRLLLARISALSLFFGGILLGTSLLGIVFLPVMSELPGLLFRQLFAHAAAALLSGLCAACSLIALQGLLICTLGQTASRRISPILQAACVLLLLTSLFLFPLFAHILPQLLQAHSPEALWYPPFWFLGVYEVLLHGARTPALFANLARCGILATATAAVLALVTYPLACTRRIRQSIEGTGLRQRGISRNPLAGLLPRILLCNPASRPIAAAVHAWVSQTILRSQAARLTLAVFGGLAFATTAAALLTLHPGDAVHAQFSLTLAPSALGIALPMSAFWAVAAFRTVLRIPVAPAAAWAFRVIHGRPKPLHLLGTQLKVAVSALVLTAITLAALITLAPGTAPTGTTAWAALLLFALAVPVLLTQTFFLAERTLPFTQAPAHSVNELSYLVLTWFAIFPLFCSCIAECLPWAAATAPHLVAATAAAISTHLALRLTKQRLNRHQSQQIDMDDETIHLPGELGLR
jgi:hypothetical protein